MKRIATFLFLVLTVAITAMADNNKDMREMRYDDIPNIALEVLEQFFPNVTIVHALTHQSKLKNKIYIELDNGTNIEFDKNGVWLTVDCGIDCMPLNMLGPRIYSFFDSRYPDEVITRAERGVGHKGYIVCTMLDGVRFVFDSHGYYVKTVQPGKKL